MLGAGAGLLLPRVQRDPSPDPPAAQLLAANGLEGAIRPALQQAAGPAVAGVLVAAVMVPTHAALGIAVAHGCALVLLLFQGPEPALVPAGSPQGSPRAEASD